MGDQDLTYFHALKKAVGDAFRQEQPASLQPIESWRGQDIVDFQESLARKLNGRISEKWFYTHIKNTQNERLPRIDMLNLLSEYAGYRNWKDFVYQEQQEARGEAIKEKHIPPVLTRKKTWQIGKTQILLGLAILLGSLSFAFIFIQQISSEKGNYELCFVDADSGDAIQSGEKIEVTWLKENESPIVLNCDENGCLKLSHEGGKIKLAIHAPYYHNDTLVRILPNGEVGEKIQLKTDDYALMIHFFSTANLKDWKKRRKQLEEMFSDEVKIFQIYQGMGVEMLNKEEFIDKLTFPLESLQKIEVLETVYDKKNKIIALRFTQE